MVNNSRFTAGISSSTRGMSSGVDTAPGVANRIQYFEFASRGNAADFGDTVTAHGVGGGHGSQTRGVDGAYATPSASDGIDYITIATVGNASDFGDLTSARYGGGACCSSTS